MSFDNTNLALQDPLPRRAPRAIPMRVQPVAERCGQIDGDDAYEFLEIIHKRFKTRFETLDWHMYFHDEPACSPFSQLKIFGYKENRRSLTFGKLLEAVQRGEWFED